MNASIGCLGLGMIVLFFIACLFIREINKHIAELKNKFEEVMGRIDYIRKEMQFATRDLNNEILKTRTDLDDLKNKLEDSEKSLDVASRLKGIEGSLKGMLDLMEQERTERLNERYEEAARQAKALYEANLASAHAGDDDKPYADIPGDLDEGFEGEESITEEQKKEASVRNILELPSPVYKWEFPTKPSSTAAPTPIIGEEYLVIGRDKSIHESLDTNVDIVSGIGTWKGFCAGRGYCGFDMDDGYKLDKVYAFIQLPSPSDVMNEVLDIRFKE